MKRQRRSAAEKRRIVEGTMVPGASIARVAREHGVNANQVFQWRYEHRKRSSGTPERAKAELLPVTMTAETHTLSEVEVAPDIAPPSDRSILNCPAVRSSALRAVLRPPRSAQCSRVCCEDRATHRDAHPDRCWIYGPASWFPGTDDSDRDGVGTGTLFWTRVRLSRQAWRSDQAVVVGWRRTMSVPEAIGARPLHLAAGNERHSCSYTSAVIDAA